MAKDDCFEKFLDEAAGDDRKNRQLLTEIEEEVKKRVKEDPDTSEIQHRVDVTEEILEFEQEDLLRKEAALAHSFQQRDVLLGNLTGLIQETDLNSRQALVETMDTAATAVVKERDLSVKRFDADLNEAGVEEFFTSLPKNRARRVQVIREIQQHNTEGGRPGISGSEEARKVAEIYTRHMDNYNARLDRIGSGSRFLEGWVVRQTWDASRLERFGTRREFVNEMRPRIDKGKTLGDEAASDARVNRFLVEFWDSRVNGTVEEAVPFTRADLTKQKTRTFANRQLDSREIHLKRAEDVEFVMSNFASGELGGEMRRGLERRAAKTASVEQFGVNPPNMSEFLQREAKRMTPENERSKFESKGYLFKRDVDGILKIANGMDELDASSPDAALIMAGLRGYTRSILLGKVFLTALPGDFATTSTSTRRLIRAAGRTNMEVSKAATNEVFRRIKKLQKTDPENLRILSEAINTAHAYSTGSMMHNVAKGTPAGFIFRTGQKAADLTMRYGGLETTTSYYKMRAATYGMSVMSQIRGSSWDELDKGLKEFFFRGQITKDDWEALRKMDDVFTDLENDGVRIMDLAALSRKNRRLTGKVQTALRQLGDEAVLTPGPREQARLGRGEKPGTFEAEAWREASFLLSWPMTFMSKGLAREARMEGGRGLALMGAKMWAAGAVAIMLNDVVSGQTRDYLTTDLAEQAGLFKEYARRGGLGGLMGDMAFNLFDPRFDEGPISAVLSTPNLELIEEAGMGAMRSFKSAVTGDFSEAAFNFVETAEDLVPGGRIPYVAYPLGKISDEMLKSIDPQKFREDERRLQSYLKSRPGGS